MHRIRWRPSNPVALAVVAVLFAAPAAAFVYPEHRDIMVEALRRLPPEQQRLVSDLWASARLGHETRYCVTDVTEDSNARPTCIDLAAWPAIAGDHSCSPEQLLTNTLTSRWILDVARVGAETKAGLAKAKTRDAKLNEWSVSNLKLQSVDPEYASRAGANNGHFLITRTSDDPSEYLKRALGSDAEPNALGLYLYYHLGAVRLAREWGATSDPQARSELARRVLATEAFAIHFLEDMFAAGHVAGSWGDVAERKGTHDYYSEFGLDTIAWNRQSAVILGDAHMRTEDLERAGAAVKQSLTQVLASLRGGSGASPEPALSDAEAATRYDSCTATKQASGTITEEGVQKVLPIVAQTPVPGRAEQDVHLPRFRQEIGLFVGFAGDLTGGLSFGGFQAPNASPRTFGAGEVGFRIGVGLEALTGSTGTGQASLGFGFHWETSQKASSGSALAEAGIPQVPSRRGFSFRLRMPFYLIPLDLIPAALVLSWASPSTMTNMGIVAASGGLFGWQSAFNTPIGAFQFLLGRDFGVVLFGYFGERMENIVVAAPGAIVSGGREAAFVSFRSLMLDFPSFEYRPLREFSTKTALTFAVQFGWGVEFPNQVRYESRLNIPAATGPTPDLGTAWFMYLRIHFDARYYF
jgi:hypothetical protein